MPHTLSLNDGHAIPQLGFGVFQIPRAITQATVETALEAGYRHLDTAVLYDNEVEVGAALAASGLPRDEVFVTTKVWNDAQGRDATRRSLQESLERLRLDVLDLYLIHWPAPAQDRYAETWATLVELQREGLVRSIGVSNFEPEHLERIIAQTGVVPAVNQIELHPFFAQAELRALGRERGIVTEAWSPLARGRVQTDPVLTAIAERHQTDPARVALAWSLQLGNVVLTRSATPERIRGNLDASALELSEDDLTAIAALDDDGGRAGLDPRTFS